MTDSTPKTTNGRAAGGLKLSSPQRATLTAAIPAATVKDHASLRQLRRQRRFTQKQVATGMGTEQDRVSRLERRADLRISTLKEYVAALGGTLKLVAEFQDAEPVTITLPERDATRRSRPLKPTVD